MSTIPQTIKTRISTVQLTNNNLLQINFDSNATISTEDVYELLDATYKMGNGKKFKKLIILGEYTLADVEAMKLATTPEGSKYQIAEAFVIKSTAQRILSIFFMHVLKPLNPTKFFACELEAQNWLLNLG